MQVPGGCEGGDLWEKYFCLTDDFECNSRLFADSIPLLGGSIPLFVGCLRLLTGYFINSRAGHGDEARAVFG